MKFVTESVVSPLRCIVAVFGTTLLLGAGAGCGNNETAAPGDSAGVTSAVVPTTTAAGKAVVAEPSAETPTLPPTEPPPPVQPEPPARPAPVVPKPAPQQRETPKPPPPTLDVPGFDPRAGY